MAHYSIPFLTRLFLDLYFGINELRKKVGVQRTVITLNAISRFLRGLGDLTRKSPFRNVPIAVIFIHEKFQIFKIFAGKKCRIFLDKGHISGTENSVFKHKQNFVSYICEDQLRYI